MPSPRSFGTPVMTSAACFARPDALHGYGQNFGRGFYVTAFAFIAGTVLSMRTMAEHNCSRASRCAWIYHVTSVLSCGMYSPWHGNHTGQNNPTLPFVVEIREIHEYETKVQGTYGRSSTPSVSHDFLCEATGDRPHMHCR